MSGTGTVPTYYSASHSLHAPPTEFLHGRVVPYHEVPARIESIKQALGTAGLIEAIPVQRALDPAQLARIHAPAMLRYLQEMSLQAQHLVRQDFSVYGITAHSNADEYYYAHVFPPQTAGADRSTTALGRRHYAFDSAAPIGSGTWQAALESASLAHAAARAVLGGQFRLAYALCRPPGHHAGPDFIGGYCYLNNAALAASVLTGRGSVAIIDVDYHHGNGTQAAFWDDPRVLFASIHADPEVEYPYYSGFSHETGGRQAPGATLNLPLPHGTNSAVYHAAFDHLMDCVKVFGPSAVVVSLGFDTYKDDPIGLFNLDCDDYARMGRLIASLDLPTVIIQEGGYSVDDLGVLAVSFFRGLLVS